MGSWRATLFAPEWTAKSGLRALRHARLGARCCVSLSAQVRGEAPDEDVVFGCHGALDAASPGRGVFTNTQAFLCGAPKKCVVTTICRRALARQVPDSLGKRNHFAESPSDSSQSSQMRAFDGLFVGAFESADPVVGKNCGVDGLEQLMPQTPMQLAQLANGPMADHPDVGFRNAQETGDIGAHPPS